MRHGVILDLQSEINKVGSTLKMLKKLPTGIHRMNHVRVPQDYNSDGSVESHEAERSDIPTL